MKRRLVSMTTLFAVLVLLFVAIAASNTQAETVLASEGASVEVVQSPDLVQPEFSPAQPATCRSGQAQINGSAPLYAPLAYYVCCDWIYWCDYYNCYYYEECWYC